MTWTTGDSMIITGAAILSAGVGWIYPAAGVITFGVLLTAIGVVADLSKSRAARQRIIEEQRDG